MDRKSRRSNSKKTPGNRRGMKNAGFIALILLFGLTIFAAYNQPSSLKQIPSTTAIRDNNDGKYEVVSEVAEEQHRH